MKKILVTGGLGYIGSITCLHLYNQGFNPIIVDNLSNSSLDALERIQEIIGNKIEFLHVDLAETSACKKLESIDFESVIHFAAKKSVEESIDKPTIYYRNNIASLINVLEICQIKSVQNFIFSSSCTVYGNTNNYPVGENEVFGKSTSAYATSKQICENIIEEFSNLNALKCVSLRYFNPIGAYINANLGEYPSEHSRNILPILDMVANGFIKSFQIFGNDYNTRDGTGIRDYIDINDLALGHIKALEYLRSYNGEEHFQAFNLGSGSGTTVKEIIEAYEKVNNVKINTSFSPRRPGDLQEIYADISKAVNLLKWKPTVSIEDSLRTSYLWSNKYTDDYS